MTLIFLYTFAGSSSLSNCITASGSSCSNIAGTITLLMRAEARLETVNTVASGLLKITSRISSSDGSEFGHTIWPSCIVSIRV